MSTSECGIVPMGSASISSVDFGLDAFAVVQVGQDLHGAREVDVGNLAALDVGVGGGVKRALRSVRHSLCDPRVTTKVAKSVSEACGQVKLASPGRRGGGVGGGVGATGGAGGFGPRGRGCPRGGGGAVPRAGEGAGAASPAPPPPPGALRRGPA